MISKFDRLYVVSDLHIGGAEGRQVFNQGALLAALINQLSAEDSALELGLVLGGDIIDYLAEPEGGDSYLKSSAQALASLRRLRRSAEFRAIFAALTRFLQTPRRRLILLIGNHDLELALPEIREELIQTLCAPTDNRASYEHDFTQARGRLELIFNGSGLRCQVGDAQVLCLHGNEFDPWNLVDQGALDRMAATRNRTSEAAAWNPNAGTALVIDVMNGIKRRYPFVDLLQPEDEIVIPVLMALDLSQAKKLLSLKLPAILGRLGQGHIRRARWLSADEASLPRDNRETRELPSALGPSPLTPSAEFLFQQVEEQLAQGIEPIDLIGEDDALYLGLGSSLAHYFGYRYRILRGESPLTALRRALSDWLLNDDTWDYSKHDALFKQIEKHIDPNFDFVIAGHTHIARAINRAGGGVYFNSGTWIRLIGLTANQLASDSSFGPIYAALQSENLAALDGCPGLVRNRPTVVRIGTTDAGTTEGELLECRKAKDGSGVDLVRLHEQCMARSRS